MNYTTHYDRANLNVIHPQLNYVIFPQKFGEFRSGRKRFDTNKNIETSGHIASYGSPLEKLSTYTKSTDKNYSQQSPSPTLSYRPSVQHTSPERVSKEIQVEDPKEAQEDHQIQTEEVFETVQENPQSDEEKIKAEILKKETEIEAIRKNLKNLYENPLVEPYEIYNRIDKAQWDKQVEAEKKKITIISLESQIHQKNMAKNIEKFEREKEQQDRLQQLLQTRQDEELERIQSLSKANKYYGDLSVQAAIRKQISEIENFQYHSPIPRPKENPPPAIFSEGQSPVLNNFRQGAQFSPEKIDPTNLFRFTKKHPKSLMFNPITGELKDTRFMEQRSFSHINPRKISPSSNLVNPRTDDERNRNYFQEAANSIINARKSPLR